MSLKPLTSTMHPNLFLKWNVDSRVANEVEKTCFRYFLKIKQYLAENDIRHDWHLLTAMIRTCKIVKGGLVFIFGKKRVVFTLEDMFFITGLQIDGYQVSGFESNKNVKVCMDHLGLDVEAAKKLVNKNGKISLAQLKEKFEVVPKEVDNIDFYVKGYLLFLIGCMLITSKSRDTVSDAFLPFLSLDKVNSYAWGAAAFSHLQSSIAEQRESSTSLKGFSYTLLVFALERIKPFQKEILGKTENSLPHDCFPLFLPWIKMANKSFKNTTGRRSIEEYITFLGSLKAKDIILRPYDRVKNLIDDGQKEGLWVAFSRVPCICFGSVFYNRPDLGLQQFEERDLNEDLKRIDKSLKLIKESAHKDKNWRNFKPQYSKANSLWRNRDKYVIFTDVPINTKFLNDDLVELQDNDDNIIDDIEQGDEDVDVEITSTPNPTLGPSPNPCSPPKSPLVYTMMRKEDHGGKTPLVYSRRKKTPLVYSRRKNLTQDHGEDPPNPPGNAEVGKRWRRDWDAIMLPEKKCQKIDELMHLRPESLLRPPNKYTPTSEKGKVKVIPGVSKKKDEEDQGHKRDGPQVEISKADLDCLAPKSFLTSNIMDFYITYLENRASSMGAGRLNCHFFNTFFYSKLLLEVQKSKVWEDRVTQLRRWWKDINIFEKAYIFVPICKNSHWSLIIICMPDKEDKSGVILLHMDSLALHFSKSLFHSIKSVLIEEWKFFRKKDPQPPLLIGDEIWQKLPQAIQQIVAMVPQQENEYDCGLFVLYFIERFLEDAPPRLKKTDIEKKMVQTRGGFQSEAKNQEFNGRAWECLVE